MCVAPLTRISDLPMKTILRALVILSPALLASCGNRITQREVLRRSQIEVAAREPWADSAAILVEEKPDGRMQLTWEIKAGALDRSGYPRYKGLNFVPGTERKLRFTPGGCLMSYSYDGSPCTYAPTVSTYLIEPADK